MRATTPSLGSPESPTQDAAHDAAWRGIESALIAAQLEEIAPDEACDRMCASLKTHLGIRCILLDGHQLRSAADDSASQLVCVRLLLGNVIDGNAATLVLTKDKDPTAPHEADAPAAMGVSRQELERLKRVFLLLLQIVHPIPRSAETLHHLRNRLAGLQANLELLEMILPRASGEAADVEPKHDEIASALDHALQVCRDMATTIRGLHPTASSAL